MNAQRNQRTAAVRKESAHLWAPPRNHPMCPRALHQLRDESRLAGLLKIRTGIRGIRSGIRVIGGIRVIVGRALRKQRADTGWG